MAGSLNTIAISGSYSDLTSKPSIPTQDTGWTANSNAGDKTIVVAAYTNGITGTMVTALNITSGGLGTALSLLADQLVAVTKKLQALETAGAANKLPNN